MDAADSRKRKLEASAPLSDSSPTLHKNAKLGESSDTGKQRTICVLLLSTTCSGALSCSNVQGTLAPCIGNPCRINRDGIHIVRYTCNSDHVDAVSVYHVPLLGRSVIAHYAKLNVVTSHPMTDCSLPSPKILLYEAVIYSSLL
jgi:hypothetical protein